MEELYVIDLKVSNCKLNISKYKGNFPEWISGSHGLGIFSIKLISGIKASLSFLV